jgi:hypothetical protein
VNISGLRPKRHESWRGLFTDSIDHLTSFPALTNTHVFGNHSNGYGHLKTADVLSFADCRKTASSMVGNPETVSVFGEDYDFNVSILLSRLGSLMICTHNLYVLTQRRRNDPLLRITRIRWPRRSR